MQSVHPLHSLMSLAALSLLVGCHPMHGPYGGYPGAYGGYPAAPMYPGTMQQAPIQTLTPGSPYVPGGTYTPGTNGTPPTYQGGSGGLQPLPESNGGSAPPYNSGSSGSGSNVPVPEPYYPSTNSGNAGSQTNFQPPAMNSLQPIQPATHELSNAGSQPQQLPPGVREIRSPETPTETADTSAPQWPAPQRLAPVEASPMSQPAAAEQPASNPWGDQPASAAPPNDNEDPFSQPVPAGVAAPTNQGEPEQAQPFFDFETRKMTPEEPTVFDHAKDYAWLQGVVARDPEANSWSIVYSDNPDAADQYAGHFTLAPSPQLEQFEDGTVVRIEGRVDPVAKDPLGKPVYLIEKVQKQGE